MKVGYFDCIGGASGDMLLSSILSAGASEKVIQKSVAALKLPGCNLSFTRVRRNGLLAIQARVDSPKKEILRHPGNLVKKLAKAKLSSYVKSTTILMIKKLALIEARIHGVPVEKVHLHELGGDDTLVDIVGVLSGLENLGLDQIYVSPLPLTRGQIDSAHGILPLPAPATLALLEKVPVYNANEVQAELVTPTGAIILTTLASGWGNFPSMRLTGKIGTGAGEKEFPFPNIIRLWLGETEIFSSLNLISEKLIVLETNIDDMDPQIYEYVIEKLFVAGALDVTLSPLQMKKNRPAVQLSVLCKLEMIDNLEEIIFRETTTLGVRSYTVDRTSLPRTIKTIKTEYGKIRIKETYYGANPEYEDCLLAAKKHKVPLIKVMSVVKNMIK